MLRREIERFRRALFRHPNLPLAGLQALRSAPETEQPADAEKRSQQGQQQNQHRYPAKKNNFHTHISRYRG